MKQDPEGTMVGNAYLHEGPDKSRAVVILTDVFGLPLINCKILADELSKKLSCDVCVPDMFAGMSKALVLSPVPYRQWYMKLRSL